MAFVLFNLAAVAALIGIDQLIKLWAVQALQPVGAMPFIPMWWSCSSCSIRAWLSACSAASSCS